MYVVIFRAKIKQLDDEYFQLAGHLREMAINQYGCIEFTAVSEENQEITLSYWNSPDDIAAWKQDAEHLLAQAKGRERWYASYTVQVTRIEREYHIASS